MTDEQFYNQHGHWNGISFFQGIVNDIEGSYEMYVKMRNEFMEADDIIDTIERYFQVKSGAKTITAFNNHFDAFQEFIWYLHDKAEEIEDYEFCAKLVKVRLYMHWKDGALSDSFNDAHTYEN